MIVWLSRPIPIQQKARTFYSFCYFSFFAKTTKLFGWNGKGEKKKAQDRFPSNKS